tara:strand:- start:5488 stop:5913 length:426 start_codon:yes stop_codon:yes gene_type:complete
MSVVLRSGTYYLRKRIPARFFTIDPRKEIWVSLKTDSKSSAQEKAKLLWVTLLVAWEARLQGNSEDAAERFEAVHDIARSKGFRYLPVQDVARLPLEELLERVEALQSGAGRVEIAEAPALLGVVQSQRLRSAKRWRFTGR